MTHARATGIAALALAACVSIPGPARAVPWSTAFANETDTTAFLTADGGLVLAPFHLASIDTLWAPTNGDFVARLRVRPGGGRIAWLTRLGDEGLTWLWTAGEGPPRSHVGFLPLQPRRYGVQRFESERPTTEDRSMRGARLLEPSATSRRISTNAFEWTEDGGAIAFAFDRGVGVVPADTGAAREVTVAQVSTLRLLDPAPFYLAEVVVPPSKEVADAAPEPEFDLLPRTPQTVRSNGTIHRYLLYPATPRWKLFEAASLDVSSPWTADEATVWWADHKTVRSVRAHDPRPTAVANASDEVVWLEHDASRHAVAWVAGRTVSRQPDAGGAPVVVFTTHQPTTQVFVAGRARVLWAGDSLIVWRPEDDRRSAVALGGIVPSNAVEGADGTVFVVGSTKRRSAASVSRLDLEHGSLVPIDAPETKNGTLVATPSRERLLWFRPTAKPPATIRMYEIATGAWSEVDNPGVIGWEPWREPEIR